MKPAVLRQISQANRALFKLKSMAVALHLPVGMQCDLFDKLIAPAALYGCEVWGLRYMKTIELFHRKFLKQLETAKILEKSQQTDNKLYGVWRIGKKQTTSYSTKTSYKLLAPFEVWKPAQTSRNYVSCHV